MRLDKKICIGCLTFLILSLSLPCLGLPVPTPLEAIKERVNQILFLLQSEKFKEAPPAERIEMLRNTAEDFFDKEEIARRTLALHWRRFSKDQRKEFIRLFQEFLEKNYYKKIGNYEYSGEKVRYRDHFVVGAKARVNTVVEAEDREIPVDYSLFLKNDKWFIYDVRIEGVSMVKNYRSQFHEILSSKSPEYLFDLLRKKLKEFSAE